MIDNNAEKRRRVYLHEATILGLFAVEIGWEMKKLAATCAYGSLFVGHAMRFCNLLTHSSARCNDKMII